LEHDQDEDRNEAAEKRENDHAFRHDVHPTEAWTMPPLVKGIIALDGCGASNCRILDSSMEGVSTADTYGGGFDGSSTFDVQFAVDRLYSFTFHGTLSSGWESELFDTPENRFAALMRWAGASTSSLRSPVQ